MCAYKLHDTCNVALRSYNPNDNRSVEGVNDTMAQMLAILGNKRQDGLNAFLRHLKATCGNCVSVKTDISPNEVLINRSPDLPLTAFEHPHARSHQNLERDQLGDCGLPADRQRRLYQLLKGRKQHPLAVSRVERRKQLQSEAFQQVSINSVCGWTCSTATTIRQAGPDAQGVQKRVWRSRRARTVKAVIVGPSSPDTIPGSLLFGRQVVLPRPPE